MLDLSQWVRRMAEDGAEQLRLQTGLPVVVSAQGVNIPITDRPLDRGAIVVALTRAGLGDQIPVYDTAGQSEPADIGGIACMLSVASHREQLQVRITLREQGAAAHPTPAPHAAAEPAPASPSPAPRAPKAKAPAQREAAPPQRAAQPQPSAPAPSIPIDDTPFPSVQRAAPHSSKRERVVARRKAGAERISVGAEIEVDEGLANFLQLAQQRGASDLHLSAGQSPKLRVVGELRSEGAELRNTDLDIFLRPLLSDAERSELARAGHVDLAAQISGIGRVRLNVSRQRNGLKACFRLVAPKAQSPASLGLPDEVKKITRYHQGLIVVSGPSGHGKTTTLASLVDLINSEKAEHIITVEDPIEIVHARKRAIVSQRQVGTHTRSFQAALKGALREDPDVIVIGELRDKETVEMALSAAETGHIVLCTMSTPNGAKTIDRLIDLFPPEDQAQVRTTLAGGLKMVLSQRLVPSVDGSRFHLAAELITGSMPLWSLIREDKLVQLPSLMQRGRGAGMIQVETSLAALVREGAITMDTARRFADDPKRLIDAPGSPGALGTKTSPAGAKANKSKAKAKGSSDRSGIHDLVGKVFRRKS